MCWFCTANYARKPFPTARVDIVAISFDNESKWAITRALRRRGLDGEEPQLTRHRDHLSPLNWPRYVFTCECMFSAKDTGGKQHVWLDKNTAMCRDRAFSTSHFALASIVMWGAITANGNAYIGPVNGTLNCQRNITLLKDSLPAFLVCDFPRSAPRQSILNLSARQRALPPRRWCSRVRDGQSVLDRHRWPAYSPDLNPIEHFLNEFNGEV
jgi:hypothetical protein